MTTLSPTREMMSLTSHTDKSHIILFRSNPEISHGSHSHELTGSLTHGLYNNCRQQNHFTQSGISKYAVSVSEPQIDHERNINGGVFSRDYIVLRAVEVQVPSSDYDNAMPSITRMNNIEEKGGFDSAVHSVSEYHDSSTPFAPLDSSEAVAEEGGSVSGESDRHLSGGGYKEGLGDSRILLQGVSLSNVDGDQNFTCARAGISSVADAKKSEMGNDLFSARAANVSSSRTRAEVKVNKEGVNNTARSSKGTVYDKYTGTRVTETTYGKLHAETAFIDQPNLSYGMVRTQPELQPCDKLVEKTGCSQAYDVDLAVTNAQADRYGTGGGGLSIIPDTVSVKRFGTGDIVDDGRLITKTVSERASTEARTTSESVVSSSTNVISTSATSVISANTKEESAESLGSNSGVDFSTKSYFKERNSVANVQPVSQPLYKVTNGAAKHTEVKTSHLQSGPSVDTKLDLTTPHIPSTVVLLPELPMIVITPSIPEATSSPSPAISSPERSIENISHSYPCESDVSKADNIKDNHMNGDNDFSSTQIKTIGTKDITSSKPAPVGGVKVLPSTFTFNIHKFKETKRTDSSAADVAGAKDKSSRSSPGSIIQAGSTSAGHAMSSVDIPKNAQRVSGLAGIASTCGVTTTSASLPVVAATSRNTAFSSALAAASTKVASTSGAAFVTVASSSGTSLTTVALNSGIAFTTNTSYSGATTKASNSGTAFTTNASNSGIAFTTVSSTSEAASTTVASTSGAASATEKAATSASVLSVDTHLPASGDTNAAVCSKHIEDYFNDYAVPSELPLTSTLESSTKEVHIASNGPYEDIENHATTNLTAVNWSKDKKDTFISHNGISVSPDKEAIYAVPIPKSQRHALAHSGSFRQTITQTEVPLKPPRSPVSSAAPPPLKDTDDDAFEDVVMRKPNKTARQMKKSTTTGTLHSHSSDYTNIPNAASRKYDYFSLGRRPKRPRIKTLTDSQGMAVSLDMLLRSRRQSGVDMSSPTANEETLSVDDILKSCLEFEDDCAFYRERTNSDVVRNSSTQPLSFRDVNNIKLLNFDLSNKEKQEKHSRGSSKPILKKSSNGKNTNLQAKQTIGPSDTIERNKIYDQTHSKPASPSSYASRADSEENEKQTAVSKKGEIKKPDNIKSYISSDTATATEYQASVKDTKTLPTSESVSSDTKLNPDYESIEDTRGSQVQPAGLFSSSGFNQNHPDLKEDGCAHVDTISDRFEPSPGADESMTPTSTPADHFNKQPVSEIPTSTISVSTLDARPTSLPHLIKSFVTTSTSEGQFSASSPVAASYSTGSSSLSPDFRDLSCSFSGMTSPSLSTSAGSDAAATSSEGIMSLLSVDVREVTAGDSPSPSQRSPSCDPKLEAAEALKWLRAAGFPQYAQMFDDGQFPVDMGIVERDHDFLDKDSLQSLFRRLETLNRYAGIKRDSHPCKKTASEEEDEDDFCALSERWEYQKSARRWSRKDLSSSPKTTVSLKDQDLADRSGSHDSLLADQDSGSQIGDSPLPKSKTVHQNVVHNYGTSNMVSVSHRGLAVAEIAPENSGQTGAPVSPRLRRAASDKMKTTKGLFKKMEGMKSTKSRRQSSHRNIVEISGPVVADRENMQAKLDKLNCVDILHDADTQLSPPLVRGSASERGQGLPSATNSRNLSSSIHAGQPSPQPPHSPSSPRPHSDFLLRSQEGKSHVPSHSAVQSRPNSASSNQRPSLVHDSSFEEYYQAQTAFLQNLQSSSRGTADSVRKNNSETNLMEIFLVPQDHQPGRFPRVLQNGYIETEACGTAVNVRTGSVRLGRNSCMKSDQASASLRPTQRSEIKNISNRLSVYDNCSPSESRRSENSGNSSVLPSAAEVESSGESKQPTGNNQHENTQLPKHGFIHEVNSDSSLQDSRDTSRESSVVRTTWNFSDQKVRNSDHERSVSFESTTSSQSPDDNTLVSVDELASDAKSSQISSPDSVSLKSKVTHSSSLDSYFKDGSGQTERAASDSSKTPPAGTFQENYDEFDRILQELYKNINDLTTFMDKDKSEKTPRLVRAATSPLPAGNTHPQTPLHVATPPARPVLKPQKPVPESSSPSSATSDLVPSPASPRSPTSPQDSSEPLDFYGILELDQENSSSGGEGSNTAESGSEDQEMALTDVSQDDSLDQIIEVSRERRDSGVGHSLTRAPSDRRRKKIRWHSFQKSHRPDISSRAMQINSLTVGQLVRLQKLSLLRLTGIMEKCLPVNKSGWNWMVPRFMKRQKVPDFNDKNVFGVPLSVMAQRTGQPLPQCVLYAMRYLRRTCPSAVGLFRKSGVKSKIQQLRDYVEAHPDTTNFDGENAYNVADMLKTYFRDLPECLLTNKMSETFRSIYTYVPPSQRLDAIQAAILLLPDENREVLQSILLFLSDISEHEADHQMNASNLAVCFTPTVFHLGPRQTLPYSPKRNRKNSSGVPDPREIMEQKAAHECLLMMITQCKKLFTVPSNLFRQLQVQSVAHVEPSLPQDIGSCPSDVRAFGQERIQMVLKESHDKNRGWVPTVTVGDVEVFHRKPLDDCLLKEWKLVVDIEAPPVEVLRRIMHERHTWDEDLLSWSVVERLDPHSDIFQYVLNSMAPHPPRNFCALRYWRSDLNKGACALITKSVEHSDALEIHGVWAVDLGTYYLMEPCGSGRSRLTYITRVDTRGRMPEWYTKIFGHICANFLDRLKESFKQDAEGPETKV